MNLFGEKVNGGGGGGGKGLGMEFEGEERCKREERSPDINKKVSKSRKHRNPQN